MNAQAFAWSCLERILFDTDTPALTETLAADLASGRLSWELLVSLANAHLVAARVWIRLREKGLDDTVPSELADYLGSFADFNEQRNAELRVQLLESIDALNDAGIRAMPLKGGAMLLETALRQTEGRFLTDIDILVPPGQEDDAAAALRRIGYRFYSEDESDYAQHHHVAPMVRPGNPTSIEVHRMPLPRLLEPALAAADIWAGASPGEYDGTPCFVPSAADSALILLLQAAVSDRFIARFSLPVKAILDLQALAQHGAAIDWQRNLERSARAGVLTNVLRFAHVYRQLTGSPLIESRQSSVMDRAHFAGCRLAARYPALLDWTARWERLSTFNLRYRFGSDAGHWQLALRRMSAISGMLRRGARKLIRS